MRRVRDVLGDDGALVLETAILADDNRHALLYCPIGKENPYEPSSVTIFNLKGLKDSLLTFGFRTDREELEANSRPDPTDKVKNVDRVVFTCSKDASLLNRKLLDYWDGAHALHSAGPAIFE